MRKKQYNLCHKLVKRIDDDDDDDDEKTHECSREHG
jgi:hypothetical protein